MGSRRVSGIEQIDEWLLNRLEEAITVASKKNEGIYRMPDWKPRWILNAWL